MNKLLKNNISYRIKYIIISIVAIIVFLVPLIMRLYIEELDGIRFLSWQGKSKHADLFHYAKAQLLIILSCVLLLVMVIGILIKKIKPVLTIEIVSVIILSFFILLSAVVSKYGKTAMIGSVSKYEGLYVLISYSLLIISIIICRPDMKLIKTLMVFLMLSASILGIIGISQYYGFDFLKTDFIKKLILGKEYLYLLNDLDFVYNKGTVYATLFNPNFVGSYAVILLPVSMGIYLNIVKIKHKILTCLVSCIIFFTLLGSMSRAGMLGGIVMIIIFVILNIKLIKKKPMDFIVLTIAFIIVFTALNFSTGRITGEFKRLDPITESEKLKDTKEVYFNKVSITGRKVMFDTDEKDFSVILNEDSTISVLDVDDKRLGISSDNEWYYLNDERYKKLKFQFELGEDAFLIYISNKAIKLGITEAGLGLYEFDGNHSAPVYPDYFGPRGYEKFASSRGYIWQTTIPLLKKTIILGTGPGTYIYTFPQRDITGKLNAFSDSTKIIDKPHNMYLQMAVNTGIISLIAFLVLLFLYIGNALKYILRTKPDNEYRLISIGILTGILGYLVAGMFNDSIVSVAPVFWTLLGIGIVINYKLKEKAIN
jgi:hypothetical protein